MDARRKAELKKQIIQEVKAHVLRCRLEGRPADWRNPRGETNTNWGERAMKSLETGTYILSRHGSEYSMLYSFVKERGFKLSWTELKKVLSR